MKDYLIKDITTLVDENRKGRTIQDIAQSINVSERTLRRAFKRANYKPKRGRRKGTKVAIKDSACVFKYVQQHPGQVLPRSTKDIHELTGCSYDSIRAYFYRKRRNLKDEVKALPPLNTLPLRIQQNGVIYDFRDIRSYTISVDYLTEILRIHATFPNERTTTFQLRVKTLQTSLSKSES